MATLTFQGVLAPAGAHALIVADNRLGVLLINADGRDVLVKLQIDLQVQQGDVAAERLVLGMERDGLDAHGLERLRLLVAAQLPFAALDQDVEGLLSVGRL